MPPYDAEGYFTPMLSESDKAKLAQQRTAGLIRDANNSLGHYINNPTSVANDHPGRSKAVVTALYQTAGGVSRALKQAAEFTDPNLSPEGLAEARKERTAAVAAAVTHRVTNLAQHLDEAYTAADKAAEAFRPKFDPNDVAQSIRTDQAWNNSIKPQLAAGKGWDQIIPTLDHDGLLAAQRFAPAHESAQRSRFEQHEVPSVIEGILRASEQRVIDSAPEGPAREAMQQFVGVRANRDAAHKSIGALAAVADASLAGNESRLRETSISAEIQIKRATFDVGAQPVSA